MRSITAVRPAQAVAVAAVTLLVGLAGSAAQASAAISGSALKKNSVPANRIKPNSLTGAQINEARLGLVPVAKLSQFAELAKSADSAKSAETAKSADSARTADLAKDAQKLNGRDQTAFLSNTVRTVSEQRTAPTGTGTTVTVSCNADEKAIGGGAVWLQVNTEDPTELNAPITASMPTPSTTGTNNMTGWKAAGYNTTGGSRTLRAYAVCVPKSA